MIAFEKFIMPNGLTVIHHEDKSTPLVVINILYKVGARDEYPDKTGFAHLFEHLMFGGSLHIPEFDTPLQLAGGENNAFTNNDITNYYITLPANNIETGFWLESDRMLSLDFSEQSLSVQKNVVIEEFKQRYLNQPYGKAWLKLRPLAYKVHPYQWPTIGKDISHIEQATLDDVKNFFYSFYAPNNAIMCVTGNVSLEKVKSLCDKWFAEIPRREIKPKNYLKEPFQVSERKEEFQSDVPLNAFYKAFHCQGRKDPEYHALDIISDVLSRGKSSRLYNTLVKDKQIFSEIDAYLTGEIDPGLFVIEGKLIKGKSIEEAEAALEEQLELLKKEKVSSKELTKVKNKIESTHEFSEMNILNKAMNLSYAELLGDAQLVNQEIEKYQQVTSDQIRNIASQLFRKENCSTLYYLGK